jgi:high-affinity Fe2+/Pb2+ permease
MNTLTFAISLPLFLIAAALFSYGLAQLARNEDERASRTMTIGFGIGLLGVVVAAIVFGFFTV